MPFEFMAFTRPVAARGNELRRDKPMKNARTISPERNYGLDVARVLAMILVLSVHISGHGVGSLEGVPVIKEAVVRFFNALSLPCVDLFALLSGYLCVTRDNWRFSRLCSLWIQIVFTGVVTAVVAHFLLGLPLTLFQLLKACFPILTCQYWYVNAYVGLFILMPVLNSGIRATDHRTAHCSLFLGFVLFSLSSVLPGHGALFSLNEGYSVAWLVILYWVGGILRLHPLMGNHGSMFFFLLSVLCSVLTWLQVLAITHIPVVANIFRGNATLNEYISPTTVLAAVFMLLGCAHLSIRSRYLCAILPRASAAAFGVYLIHAQFVVWNGVFAKGAFSCVMSLPLSVLTLFMVAAPVLLFMLLAVLEEWRQRLFAAFIPKHISR